MFKPKWDSSNSCNKIKQLQELFPFFIWTLLQITSAILPFHKIFTKKKIFFFVCLLLTAPLEDHDLCSQEVVLQNVHEKLSTPPRFCLYTAFIRVFPTSFFIRALCETLHCTLTATNRKLKSRVCFLWEDVTSLPCRKYNYSIVQSVLMLLLVWFVQFLKLLTTPNKSLANGNLGLKTPLWFIKEASQRVFFGVFPRFGGRACLR